jgi:Tfp pilus assembly protein PilF
VTNGWLPLQERDAALAHARKAMQLDPSDYYNHWDVAFVLWHKKEFAQAIERYRRAVALNPNDADLLAEFGDTLVYWGEPEEGIALLRRAMAINPLAPDWYRWNLAFALFMVDRPEESEAEIAQILNPHSNIKLIAAANQVRFGDRPAARRLIEAFLRQQPDYTLSMLRRRTVFRRPEDEAKWLAALTEAGLPE